MGEYRAPIWLSAFVAAAALSPLLLTPGEAGAQVFMRYDLSSDIVGVPARNRLAEGLAEMARITGLPCSFFLRERSAGGGTSVSVVDADTDEAVGTIHWVGNAEPRLFLPPKDLRDTSSKSEALAAAVKAVFETEEKASVPRGSVIQWSRADDGYYRFAGVRADGRGIVEYSDGAEAVINAWGGYSPFIPKRA